MDGDEVSAGAGTGGVCEGDGERTREDTGVRSVSSTGVLDEVVGPDLAADEPGSMILMGIRRRFGGDVAGSVCG